MWLVRLRRFLTVATGLVLVLGIVAYAGAFTTSPTTAYTLGGFWPTWILSTIVVGVSGPMSYVTVLGDYSRYVSPLRHRPRAVLTATAAGLLIGLLVPSLFGTFTALAARAGTGDYIGPLVDAAPTWYLLPLLLHGLLGTVGNSISLYSMGLDLDAVLPRWSRMWASGATNAFPSPLRRVRPYIVPVYDYTLATEPLTDAQLSSIGWQGREGVADAANQFHYYRLTRDNRIVWGGYDTIYHFGGALREELDHRPRTYATLARRGHHARPARRQRHRTDPPAHGPGEAPALPARAHPLGRHTTHAPGS